MLLTRNLFCVAYEYNKLFIALNYKGLASLHTCQDNEKILEGIELIHLYVDKMDVNIEHINNGYKVTKFRNASASHT